MRESRTSPLTSADQLAADLAGSTPPVLLDVRWKLGEPSSYGRELYLSGHIPGARYVSLDEDLAEHPDSPVGARGRHPLPDCGRFAAVMRRAGVGGGVPVVVYDDGDGSQAARAWWLLRHYGHADVRVLDGGFAAWGAAGRPTREGDPVTAAAEGDFEAVETGLFTVLDHDGAAAVAADADGRLLDARAGARFRGETEPVDPVAGHVPGAVSAPTSENLGADGHFLAADVLAARFAALGIEPDHTGPVAVYCGSGVSATQVILALAAAGIEPEGVGLYEGSWSGWASDPSRPVATGA